MSALAGSGCGLFGGCSAAIELAAGFSIAACSVAQMTLVEASVAMCRGGGLSLGLGRCKSSGVCAVPRQYCASGSKASCGD